MAQGLTPEQQAAIDNANKVLAGNSSASQQEKQTSSEFGRTFLQGLTFGTADEIEAWLRSANDEEYEQLLNEIRGNLDAYSEASPIAAGGAEIAGALLPAVVATITTGGAGLAAVGSRLPKLTQLIGKATGKVLGTTGTKSLAGGTAVGGTQGALTGFGKGEGGLDQRTRRAVTGGVEGAVFGAGAEVLGGIAGKTFGEMIDWARRNKGAKASSAAERFIQNLAQERNITPEEAYRIVAEGGMLIENKTVRDIMRSFRATGGEAADIMQKGLMPRPSATRKEVTEYLEQGLGGQGGRNIITQNETRLDELKDQAGELYKQEWAKDSVPGELVSEMANIFSMAPKAFAAIEEALDATPGATRFFKRAQDGSIVVTRVPTIGEAELVRRALAERANKMWDKKSAVRAEPLNDLENSLRNLIDNISPKTQEARATWRQMNNESKSFDLGKKLMKSTPEFDDVQRQWNEALALGDETTKAFRLGVMSSLRRMLGGGSAASTVKKLLDEENAQGQVLREIFPEQNLPEMLRRLSVAKDANEAANEILGQSPTAITNALVKKQAGTEFDLLDIAMEGSPTIALSRMLLGMVKKTQPELTPGQRSEIVMLMMSQDADRIKQLLQDESGIARVQGMVEKAGGLLKRGGVRAGTQMQYGENTVMNRLSQP